LFYLLLKNHYVDILQIIWFSPSGAPIAKDANLYTQDERVSIQQPYNTDFNIVIENVKESDQGIYICMVIGGMDEKRITLIIKCE